MKRNLLRILPMLLLGGVLGLTAAPAAFQAIGVKAEDAETKQVKFTPSKIKSVIASSYGSTSKTFTLDGINFGDTNICYQGSSGSEYIQIKSGTSNGFWSTSSFEDFYISNISMTVANNSCALGLSSTSTFGGLTTVATGAYSQSYTATQGYKYFKIMSGGSATQIKNLAVTYTKNSGEPLPPFEGDYKLVEDASDLKTGDKIVLGSAANSTANGTFGDNQYFSSALATISDGELSSDGADEISLIKVDGGWNLYTENEGYIGCKEVGKLEKDKQDLWTILVGDDGAATISNDTYKLLYNVNSPRFSCYTSAPNESMLLPEIYKSKSSEADTFTVSYNANGGSGEIIDSNSYTIGSAVTLKENSFTAPENKEFKEWNTKADGSGASYAPGSTFPILKDTTIYAIWKDSVIEDGNYFELVNSISDISAGDVVLLGVSDGEHVKVNGGISNEYLTAHSYAIANNKFFVPTSDTLAKPLTLGVSDGYWTMTYNQVTIAAYYADTNKLCAAGEKTNAVEKWSFEFSGTSVAITNKEDTFGKLQYNAQSSGRFSNYPKKSQTDPSLYKMLGTKAKVILDADSKSVFVDQESTVKVESYEGFVPTSYEWSIVDGASNISFIGATNTNIVKFKGLAEGTATIKVKCNDNDEYVAGCAINVLAKEESIIEEGNYFLANNAETNLLATYNIIN